MDCPLPSRFTDLEKYVPAWALATQDSRSQKRRNASREDLRAFYDALLPHMEAILTELDRFPLGQLPASHQTLYALVLTLAEIAPNMELYRGEPLVPYAFAEDRMLSMHGNYPTWQGLQPTR